MKKLLITNALKVNVMKEASLQKNIRRKFLKISKTHLNKCKEISAKRYHSHQNEKRAK